MLRHFVIVGALLLWSAPARAELVRIDFEGILGPATGPVFPRHVDQTRDPSEWYASLDTDGFIFEPTDSGLFVQNSDWGNYWNFYPTNGTDVLSVRNDSSQVTLRAAGGELFSLLSLDLGADPWFQDGAESIALEAFRNGVLVNSITVGGVSHTSYLTAEVGSLGPADTVRLTGIGRGDLGIFVTDNLRVHRAPEPSTLLLIGVGILAARARGRRQTRPQIGVSRDKGRRQ